MQRIVQKRELKSILFNTDYEDKIVIGTKIFYSTTNIVTKNVVRADGLLWLRLCPDKNTETHNSY